MTNAPEEAQRAPNPLYVSFISELNPTSVEALLATVAGELLKNFDELHLLLSTPGGTVREGIALYNMLRALPLRIITYNTGSVNSIGNVVFLAGDERYASKTSSFMFHGVGIDLGNVRLEEKHLRERLDNLLNDQSLIADIITDRTNIDAEEAKALFLRAAFMRADEAKIRGIIDDIREPQIPQGTPLMQLVFQR